MTIIDTPSTTETLRPASIGRTLARPFVAFGRMLVLAGDAYYEASEASGRATYLMSLSDNELRARGIERSDIPRIAFRHLAL